MDSSKSYYEKREQQERDFAAKSGDEGARRSHLKMAERYRELIESGETYYVQFARAEQRA